MSNNSNQNGGNAWLASMVGEAAVETVGRAMEAAGGIDPDAVARVRSILEADLEGAILDVLDTMSSPTIALQPILHVEGGTAIGYEALARFGGGTATADAFRRAAERNMHVEIELAALTAALERLVELPPTAFLGVNVSAEALLDSRVTEALIGAQTGRLVVELTKQSDLDDVSSLVGAFRALQANGAVICVDGAGTGFFDATRILELGPEIIKISRSLIARCDTDDGAREQIAAMVSLGRRLGALSIATGVERYEQHDVLQRIGVDAVQGHLFGEATTELLASGLLSV
ncbi:MAG: EAL domain-containing protein [Ilumatobacter sp.]